MTEIKEVEQLIRFYRARGWNYMEALEFTVRKLNGSWPGRKLDHRPR